MAHTHGSRRLAHVTRLVGALLALALCVVSLRGLALPHAADAATIAALPD